MTTVAFWVVALIINNISYVGTYQYPNEDTCKKEASVAVGFNVSCIPIYGVDKGVVPMFDCQDGDMHCQFQDMGGV